MEFVNIGNMDDLTKAIQERNQIEREKLKFEKEMFEFNKQLNVDSVKANKDMVDTMAILVNRFDTIDKAINALSQNDAYLKQEIDNLKTLSSNNAE